MDRDQRWERVQRAYAAIVDGVGLHSSSATGAVLHGLRPRGTDELIQPTVIVGVDGTMHDGDVVVHFNFRADRARQLIHACVDGDEFDRKCLDRGIRGQRNLLVVTTDRIRVRPARRGRISTA